MTKYHINPEAGEPGTCRALIKCRFGQSSEEHFDSKEEAREVYEQSQETKKPRSKAFYSDRAIEVPLGGIEQPAWVESIKEETLSKIGNSTVEVIDIIPTPDGEMAVTWEGGSTRESDLSIQNERGFKLPGINLRDMKTGEISSYVRFSYTDKEAFKKAFGDDEWSAFKFVREFDGARIPIVEYKDPKNNDYSNVDVFTDSMTPEERLTAKQKVWQAGFNNSKATLISHHFMSLPMAERGRLIELAPTDEKVLDKELDQLREEYAKDMNNFVSDHSEPTIDYSEVNPSLRGSGVGSALYIYGARMLARDGHRLRGSGVQSDSAQELWKRFAANEKLPMTKEKKTWIRHGNEDTYFFMDFRKNEN